jgi:hypothetical protein
MQTNILRTNFTANQTFNEPSVCNAKWPVHMSIGGNLGFAGVNQERSATKKITTGPFKKLPVVLFAARGVCR